MLLIPIAACFVDVGVDAAAVVVDVLVPVVWMIGVLFVFGLVAAAASQSTWKIWRRQEQEL